MIGVEYLAFGTRYHPRGEPVQYTRPWELYAVSRLSRNDGVLVGDRPFFQVARDGDHAVHEELVPGTPAFEKVAKWVFGTRNIFNTNGAAIVSIDQVAELLELPKPINIQLRRADLCRRSSRSSTG